MAVLTFNWEINRVLLFQCRCWHLVLWPAWVSYIWHPFIQEWTSFRRWINWAVYIDNFDFVVPLWAATILWRLVSGLLRHQRPCSCYWAWRLHLEQLWLWLRFSCISSPRTLLDIVLLVTLLIEQLKSFHRRSLRFTSNPLINLRFWHIDTLGPPSCWFKILWLIVNSIQKVR